MKRLFFFLVVLCGLLGGLVWPSCTSAQGVTIHAPREGDILRGKITLTGNSEVTGFKLMALHFTYQAADPSTWFLIYETQSAVHEGPLATWDTTQVTDGLYQLRIRVFLENGDILEDIVPNVRVGNDLPFPTPTAEVRQTALSAASSPQPTPTRQTPTPFPENPLIFGPESVQRSLRTGALLALMLIFILGLYRIIRRS
jgi:hypothetical protein